MTDELKFFDPETGKPLHRVPEGATIPKDTPYVYVRADGSRGWMEADPTWYVKQDDDTARFTREPIAPPKPPLPTQPGSTIRAVGVFGNECSVMTRSRSGFWCGVDQKGTLHSWIDADIQEWETVTLVPTETWDRLRVLDPEDKRDRVDRDGHRLYRRDYGGVGDWAYGLAQRRVDSGPLRFADEVGNDE